jgi:hypothetical protein
MLVLAGGNDPIYQKMESLWLIYMNSHPEIDCYLYKGDFTMKEEFRLDTRTKILYIKIHDSFETVLEKTVRAFKFFEPEFDKYDFIYRTNMSSFVVFDRYVEYCNSIKERDNFCSAVVGRHLSHPFPSGSGFTITPDLVRRFITDRYDDSELMLTQWSIDIHDAKRIDLLYKGAIIVSNLNDPSIFHFRLKSESREYDAQIYEYLVKRFYTDSLRVILTQENNNS